VVTWNSCPQKAEQSESMRGMAAAAQTIPASHKQEIFDIVHIIARLRKEEAQNLEEVEAHLAHIMGHNCSYRFT